MARATPLPPVNENEGPGSPQSGACRPCFLLPPQLRTPAVAVWGGEVVGVLSRMPGVLRPLTQVCALRPTVSVIRGPQCALVRPFL